MTVERRSESKSTQTGWGPFTLDSWVVDYTHTQSTPCAGEQRRAEGSEDHRHRGLVHNTSKAHTYLDVRRKDPASHHLLGQLFQLITPARPLLAVFVHARAELVDLSAHSEYGAPRQHGVTSEADVRAQTFAGVWPPTAWAPTRKKSATFSTGTTYTNTQHTRMKSRA